MMCSDIRPCVSWSKVATCRAANAGATEPGRCAIRNLIRSVWSRHKARCQSLRPPSVIADQHGIIIPLLVQAREIDHPVARDLALDQVNRDPLHLGADHPEDFDWHGDPPILLVAPNKRATLDDGKGHCPRGQAAIAPGLAGDGRKCQALIDHRVFRRWRLLPRNAALVEPIIKVSGIEARMKNITS